METAKVRILRGMLIDSRVYSPGDVVEVETGERLEAMFESESAVYADPGRRTPTPDEIRDRRVKNPLARTGG
ncbi:hypothetical protein ACYOEI_41000 [Singulisphaera rosea]